MTWRDDLSDLRHADGFAIAVMEEIGIDINTHQPKSFEDLEFEFYDVM